MSGTVFLHVGLPKSGTSYLQQVLAANKPALADRERLLFPGDGWKDQVAAVRNVRRIRRRRQETRGAWRRLVAEISEWSGSSVVSMEWLCAATPDEVERIVEALAPADVHAIFTVRDLGRTLPSSWQEMMQNRKPWTWDEFLEDVTSPSAGGRAGRRFWSQRDLSELLPRWADALPPGRVHVVTVPPTTAGPDELWRRFCSVLGIDPHGYQTQDLGGNASLGLESAELMRRLNAAAHRAGWHLDDYHTVYKRLVAKRLLATRRAQESRLSVPERHRAWLEKAAEQQLQVIRSSGVEVVGDLDDLRVPPPTDGKQPGDLDLEDVLSAAVDALVGLGRQHVVALDALEGVRKERAALERRLARTRRRLAAASGRLDELERHPARASLELTARRLRSLRTAKTGRTRPAAAGGRRRSP